MFTARYIGTGEYGRGALPGSKEGCMYCMCCICAAHWTHMHVCPCTACRLHVWEGKQWPCLTELFHSQVFRCKLMSAAALQVYPPRAASCGCISPS